MPLEVRDVGLTLRVRGRERTLLEPLSLKLPEGRIIGVTGPSGSGKSTLLRIVAGLEPRSGGAILLDGTPVDSAGLPDFRCRVAHMPQSPQPGDGTPAELLRRVKRFGSRHGAFPDTSVFERELAHLGLAPNALEHPWKRFSGGEQSRVVLALVLGLGPGYLLLDEPTFGLDGGARERVVERLRRSAREGLGILLVTHDELLLASLAERILILYDGAIHGEGLTVDVLPAAVAAVQPKDAG